MDRKSSDRPPRCKGPRRLASKRAGVLLGLALALVIAAPPAAVTAEAKAAPEILVRKSASCGCCAGWVAHLRKKGFKVVVENVENLELHKKLAGVPEKLQSCHTAVVSGYIVEGHVPAASIRRFLAEKPKARGLAVPGMPMGAPGMGGERERFDVLIFQRNGSSKVYDKY